MSRTSFIDLTGKRFGKLTVIERAADRVTPKGHKYTCWLCKCDCGNTVIANGQSLTKHERYSCGCDRRNDFYKNRYFGKTRTMKCGLKATIIDYKGCDDMTVKFEDGLIKMGVSTLEFNERRVKHDD